MAWEIFGQIVLAGPFGGLVSVLDEFFTMSVFWIWSGSVFWLCVEILWFLHFLLESLILAQDERWRRA
ncbi:hypothetical protein ACN95_18615 [Gordonia sihwensis]|nr:hypothetical protein [Gordonia sihwensis]